VKRLLAAGVLLCCVLAGGAASAALVKTGNLVLTADGGFAPSKLPRRSYVPIDFWGHANLKAVDGGVPTAVQQIAIDFDRDGRLGLGGLTSCRYPQHLEGTSSLGARETCGGALVGEGRVAAMIALPGAPPVKTSSELLIFNGPRQDGHPTAILHARFKYPSPQTYLITVPIERRRGLYRYRVTIDVPPIADGFGSLVQVSANIGRRYRYRDQARSYVSGRCGDGIFRTHGRFTFADGTIVDGSVEKPCTVR
jgi:hypothetical protein